MEANIRLAAEKDVSDIIEVYKPEILNGYSTFEVEIPQKEEMWKRMSEVLKDAPWLVAEKNNTVIAYCYTTRFNGRYGYRYTRQLSIYVHPDFQGRGIAKLLLNKMFRILELQGFKKVISLIALPNKSSEKLHKQYGFRKVGHIEKVGYKHGKWVDIGYYLKVLNESGPSKISGYEMCL